MAGKFKLFKDRGGQFRFSLNAGNGEPILASEGYKARAGVISGIESVRKNSQIDDRYNRTRSANDKHYFNLLAGNSEIIGTSELYNSTQSLETGIASVKANAPEARVDDQT